MRKTIFATFIFLVTACRPMLEPVPLQASIPLSVRVSSDVNPSYLQVLASCVKEHPNVALLINEGNSPDITIQLGEPGSSFSGFTALLGWEEITIVTNRENRIGNIKRNELKEIYKQSPPRFSAWSYPQNSPLRMVFDEIIMDGAEVSPYTFLAPNPDSMLDAIRQDNEAIGFLPASWVTEDIAVIELEDETQNVIQLPVLGITESDPKGAARAILVCMQDRGD